MGEYKIRDLETLTGVKAHTLRIWEKRYGLIRPERTDTQIRTYSDHELVTLLNVALLNKNGLKISKIARMTP
ncbi:MAG: MerR family transcriptional regulator, partial [Bacteroidota bacterium]